MNLTTIMAGTALLVALSAGSTTPSTARTLSFGELKPALDSTDVYVDVRAGRGAGVARGGVAVHRGAMVGGGAVVRGGTAIRGGAVVHRGGVAVVRPVRPWVSRPYYGRVIGGVALGTLIVVTAGAVPPAPASDLCWYWADPSQSQGYWDYCR
jgi:hypothetical protein